MSRGVFLFPGFWCRPPRILHTVERFRHMSSDPTDPRYIPPITSVSCIAGNGTLALSWVLPDPPGYQNGSSTTPQNGIYYNWFKSGVYVDNAYLGTQIEKPTVSETRTGLTNGTPYTIYYFPYAKFTLDYLNPPGPLFDYVGDMTTVVGVPGFTSVPLSVTVVGVTTGSVSVNWGAPQYVNHGMSIIGYKIEYKRTMDSTWLVFSANTGNTTTSATIGSLTPGTQYDVRITAIVTGGYESLLSSTGNGYSGAATVPSEPLDVVGTGAPNSVNLSWTAPSSNGGEPITDYLVYRAFFATGPWTLFVDSVSTATSTVVTGLTNGQNYYFSVIARNSIGDSLRSLSSAAIKPVDVPAKPIISSAVSGDKSVKLFITAGNLNGGVLSDYQAEYSDDNGATWTSFNDGVSTSGIITVTGLTGEVPYVFRARVVTNVGTGPWSDIKGPVTPTDVPGKPLALVASVDNTDSDSAIIKLDWNEPATNGGKAISGYRIQESTDGGVTWSRTLSSSDWMPWYYASVDYSDPFVAVNYVYRVAAINANGVGPYSDVSNVVTPRPPAPTNIVPTAPLNVSAEAGDKQITVYWSTPVSDGGNVITSYKVEYSTDGGTTWSSVTEPA